MKKKSWFEKRLNCEIQENLRLGGCCDCVLEDGCELDEGGSWEVLELNVRACETGNAGVGVGVVKEGRRKGLVDGRRLGCES